MIKKYLLLGIIPASFFISSSYAGLYVSPNSYKQPDAPKAATQKVVISFANNIPLSKVVSSVFPKYKARYFKVDPNQKLAWDWSGQPSNRSPIALIQTKYGIYIYANKKTKKVGVSRYGP